jgi:hypothetical protein
VEDYAEAISVLNGRTRRKVANNTYIEIDSFTGDIGIRLHATQVVVFKIDGSIILNSRGWRTVTTKDRMNNYTPKGINISSTKGTWFVYKGKFGSYDDYGHYTPNPDLIKVEYEDGIDVSKL